MDDLSELDLHDATLDDVALSWPLATCVMRLRRIGRSGGVPVEIRWHGVVSVQVEHAAPWGPSASVLETRSLPDGTDELHLQSGDVLRVRAKGRDVRDAVEPPERRHAELVVGALADARLVERGAVGRAVEIATIELRARRGIGDW